MGVERRDGEMGRGEEKGGGKGESERKREGEGKEGQVSEGDTDRFVKRGTEGNRRGRKGKLWNSRHNQRMWPLLLPLLMRQEDISLASVPLQPSNACQLQCRMHQPCT